MTLKVGQQIMVERTTDKGGLRPILLGHFLEAVAGLPPETRLYLLADAEGNAVNPLMCVGLTAEGLELVPGDWSGDPWEE